MNRIHVLPAIRIDYDGPLARSQSYIAAASCDYPQRYLVLLSIVWTHQNSYEAVATPIGAILQLNIVEYIVLPAIRIDYDGPLARLKAILRRFITIFILSLD